MIIPDALRRAETLYPDRPAVISAEGSTTWAETARRCRQVAGALAALGVEHGDRVATLLNNGPAYLELFFAVPGLGAVIVPLNNRHAAAEHRTILDDCSPRVLITDPAHAPVAEGLADLVDRVLVLSPEYEALVAAAIPRELGRSVQPDDLAILFYTSGTTGDPKGVMLSHSNNMHLAWSQLIELAIDTNDIYLHQAPMFHIGDTCATYALTCRGAAHAFIPQFDPSAARDAFRDLGVTMAMGVPLMLSAILAAGGGQEFLTLRTFSHGGAPIAPATLEQLIAAFPNTAFVQGYGASETTGLVSLLVDEQTLVGDGRLTSAGRPIIGVDVRILRADGSDCEVDETGEIVVRGPNVMQGYWNRPDATAAVLQDGWYRTGDLGYRDADWYLYLTDRAKDMIITGGENVYSLEVETALSTHPAVALCAVIGVPDDRLGERVHAVVQLRPGTELAGPALEQQLQDWCRPLLAGFKLPRSFEVRDALPLTASMKVRKQELREPYWRGSTRSIS